MKKMTLDEISTEIGVSRTTIYKVINDKGYVTEATKTKVLEALEEYHYIPNYNARELARRKKYTIAYIGMIHISAAYFAPSVKKGFARAYNDFIDNGLEIIVRESYFETPKEQLKHIDEMYELGIKNFIITPSDEKVLANRIDELKNEGCNVICLSRKTENYESAFVGVNYYKSGMLAGEMLSKIMPAGGNVAVITNISEVQDMSVRGRYRGFVDWINMFSNIKIIETIENVNSDMEAEAALEYLIDTYYEEKQLDAVYDVAYKLDLLAEKISQKALIPRVKLIGFDVYSENIEYIKSGDIDIAIGQQLVEQAYDAARMMFQKICYGIPYEEKDYFAKLQIIVASNVEYYIDC